MTKHTPEARKWRIGRPSVADGVQIFADYDGLRMGITVVCTMPRKGKGRAANVRLIVAAPETKKQRDDLLGELKSMVAWVGEHDPEMYARQLRNARAVIAKAEAGN